MSIKQILLIIVIGAALISLYDTLYIVNEGQQVIITQFGRPVGEPIKEAGLYVKMPFFEKVTTFEKRILTWDGEPNEVPTNDKTFIWVDTSAKWRIVDPLRFLQRLGDEERAVRTMNQVINGAIRDLVTKNDLSEVILSSDWKKEYAVSSEITQDINRNVEVGRDNYSKIIIANLKPVAEDYGIEILDILINRLNYTDQVREKVFER